MSNIADAELEQYLQTLAHHNFTQDDFEPYEIESVPMNLGIYPLSFLTLTCAETGKAKKYTAGPQYNWVEEFAGDLERGFFKQ